MTKQAQNVGILPTPQRVGAPDEIVTTRLALSAAIREAIAETFSDPFVFGPVPRETAVSRIIAGICARVSA
jgi:hypothetical protein